MKLAGKLDKSRVVSIISEAFENNKSVNWVVKQDHRRLERIRFLAEYAFDVCFESHGVYLSDDASACALLQLPNRRKSHLKSIIRDIKFAFRVVGIRWIHIVMRREQIIKSFHPKEPFAYLWFIGVDPKSQRHGHGSQLLMEILKYLATCHKLVCLETSTITNLPWYHKFGFTIYQQLDDFGYTLYMLKKELV